MSSCMAKSLFSLVLVDNNNEIWNIDRILLIWGIKVNVTVFGILSYQEVQQ